MVTETYYWFFSTAAQAIAAFIALLLAGYAIVLTVMQNLQQNDPSLVEIHDSLKKRYYLQLKIIAFITAASIILNLICVFLTPITFPFKLLVIILTILLTAAAIFLGFWFVIQIINPEKYQKEAKELLKKFGKDEVIIDSSQYLDEFIRLEKKMRDFLRMKDQYITKQAKVNMKYSVREMIVALYRNNHISRFAYEKLLKVNQYRNLIVHGHIDEIPKYMIDDLENVKSELEGRI